MLAILALVLLSTGCTESASQTCVTNADCFAGEVCDQISRLCGSPAPDMALPDMTPADMGQPDQADQAQGPLAAPGELLVAPSARGTLTLSWAPVPGARRYQVKIVEAGQDWQDSGISPGWEDLAPPPIMLSLDAVSASPGEHFSHVALKAQTTVSADARRYQVRALDAEGMPGAEASASGALTAQSLSYVWEVAREPGAFTALAGATSAEVEDTQASESGARHTYRVRISAPGLAPLLSEEVEGWRKRPKVVQLIAAAQSNCVLFEHGKVRCWGAARQSGAQRGFNTHIVDPSEVGDLELGGEVARLFGGTHNMCAIMKVDGKVRCWGENTGGQLGDPSVPIGDIIGDEPGEMPPRVVVLSEPVIAGASGLHHTCVIGMSGKIYCWGQNNENMGQLGDRDLGTTIIGDSQQELDALRPVDLPNFKATKIGAGASHACATGQDTADNTIKSYCWGSNTYGQLGTGDNTSYGRSNTETDAAWPPPELKRADGTRLISLSVGGGHTCGIFSANVFCWGSNNLGQLATGDTLNTKKPNLRVELGGPVQSADAGAAHTCALMSAGEVRCWGLGDHGELGTGSTNRWGDNETTKPPAVALEPGIVVKSLSAGGQHTCALLSDDAVRCWGDNITKQLGIQTPDKLGDRRDTLPNDPKYNVPLLKK
jgi:alpha-tubulin suppressor-like RCC1 family protein